MLVQDDYTGIQSFFPCNEVLFKGPGGRSRVLVRKTWENNPAEPEAKVFRGNGAAVQRGSKQARFQTPEVVRVRANPESRPRPQTAHPGGRRPATAGGRPGTASGPSRPGAGAGANRPSTAVSASRSSLISGPKAFGPVVPIGRIGGGFMKSTTSFGPKTNGSMSGLFKSTGAFTFDKGATRDSQSK